MMTGLMQTGFHCVAAAAAAIPLRPPAASSIAEGVDHLYYFTDGDHAVFYGR